MALTPPHLSWPPTIAPPHPVGFLGDFYEPLPPGIASISNDNDGPAGGAPSTPPQGPAPVPREPTRVARLRSTYLAGGMARDAAHLAAKWAVMGSLAYVLPSPWGWFGAAATMGAVLVFNGSRLFTHVRTQNPDRYEAKYGMLMERIDSSWTEINRLRKDETIPLHDRARRYRELLGRIRETMAELEEMSACDPDRVMASGSVYGILYLFFAAVLIHDERAPARYERESLLRSCRRFVNSLPTELPALPPEPTEEEDYREISARFRVEAPAEFSDFEDELEAIEKERVPTPPKSRSPR